MKKIAVLLLVVLQLITFTGCWDLKEPEDLTIIIAFGAGYNKEENKYRIYSQAINPLTMGESGGGGSSAETDYWTAAADGYTIFEATSNLRKKMSRRLYYAHTQLEIYSEKMAREKGVFSVMDAIERSRETRPIIIPAVAKGNDEELEDIMTRAMPLESVSTRGLERQLQITDSEVGGAVSEKTALFLNKLTAPGVEPVAPFLEPLEEDSEEDEGKSPLVRVSGLAAFKGDKLAGNLNNQETRGYNWTKGRVKSTSINIELPGKDNEYATILCRARDASQEPVFVDGEPEISLKVTVQGRVVNLTDYIEFKAESKDQESLNRRLAESVENDIKHAIEKARELDSDIFGFGLSFYRYHYQDWKKMEDDWDEIFQEIPVNINVKADIKDSGLINNPIKPR